MKTIIVIILGSVLLNCGKEPEPKLEEKIDKKVFYPKEVHDQCAQYCLDMGYKK